MSCDRYIDQHARTALQCSPDEEHMCSGHWTLPHTRESHLVKAFHNSDMCCRVSHTFFPHNSTHSELRGCVDTTARFCTHATRGEAQDNMHSLFGVALHRARVLGAALVESTEQGPQGAKAPGVHGRAARRFEVPTIEVPTIEVPASEVPANEAWSSRAPMRMAPSSVVPASVVPLWSTRSSAPAARQLCQHSVRV